MHAFYSVLQKQCRDTVEKHSSGASQGIQYHRQSSTMAIFILNRKNCNGLRKGYHLPAPASRPHWWGRWALKRRLWNTWRQNPGPYSLRFPQKEGRGKEEPPSSREESGHPMSSRWEQTQPHDRSCSVQLQSEREGTHQTGAGQGCGHRD